MGAKLMARICVSERISYSFELPDATLNEHLTMQTDLTTAIADACAVANNAKGGSLPEGWKFEDMHVVERDWDIVDPVLRLPLEQWIQRAVRQRRKPDDVDGI